MGMQKKLDQFNFSYDCRSETGIYVPVTSLCREELGVQAG